VFLWALVGWLALGVGVHLCVVALDAPAVQAAAWAGLACYCGIVS
jgi:hypothetical protein